VIGVDTNILVRYLTKDDEQQWEKAVEIIEGTEKCFVANYECFLGKKSVRYGN
jgi:predicted nucleic-acid-binding protein